VLEAARLKREQDEKIRQAQLKHDRLSPKPAIATSKFTDNAINPSIDEQQRRIQMKEHEALFAEQHHRVEIKKRLDAIAVWESRQKLKVFQ
jgi:hypothetical protein